MSFQFHDKPLTKQALVLATEHHRGVVRKYTAEPYINHPVRVAENLLKEGFFEDRVLAAAMLHDCLEDENIRGCTMDVQTINALDPTVYSFVRYLTAPTGGNRAERKRRYRQQMSGAPLAAKAIKCADIIDNVDRISTLDPKFAVLYLEEKRQLVEAIRQDTDPRYFGLWLKAKGIIENETAAVAILDRSQRNEREAKLEAEFAAISAEIERRHREEMRAFGLF